MTCPIVDVARLFWGRLSALVSFLLRTARSFAVCCYQNADISVVISMVALIVSFSGPWVLLKEYWVGGEVELIPPEKAVIFFRGSGGASEYVQVAVTRMAYLNRGGESYPVLIEDELVRIFFDGAWRVLSAEEIGDLVPSDCFDKAGNLLSKEEVAAGGPSDCYSVNMENGGDAAPFLVGGRDLVSRETRFAPRRIYGVAAAAAVNHVPRSDFVSELKRRAKQGDSEFVIAVESRVRHVAGRESGKVCHLKVQCLLRLDQRLISRLETTKFASMSCSGGKASSVC